MSSYERVNEPTPAGGDYSEINYLNDDNDVVDSSEAKKCVIRECKADGTLIMEHWEFVPTKRDMDMVHYVHTAAESAEGVVNDLTQFD